MRKIVNKKSLWILLAFLPSLVLADFKISQYQFFKDIQPLENKSGDFIIKIDNDVYKNASAFFTDLRVINQNNNEIKYLIDKISDQIKVLEIEKKLPIISQKNKTYILDRGDDNDYLSKIFMETDSVDFTRVVDVYGSNLKDSRYERLSDKRGDLISVTPARKDLSIDFKYSNYRYLKLVFSGNEGEFKLKSFYLKKAKREVKPGRKEELKLNFEVLENNDSKIEKVLLTVPGDNLPIESFVIKTRQGDFNRRIKIYASNDKEALILDNGRRYDSDKNYWKEKYDGEFRKKVYYDEQVFKVNDNKKYYLLLIDNGDNQPIEIKEVLATRYPDFIFLNDLDFQNNTYRLYYGNSLAKKPAYDLTSFRKSTKQEANLLKEKKNPLYVEPKKSLGKERPYLIYFFIAFLVLILLWFAYKILKEDMTKDKDETDYVDKL